MTVLMRSIRDLRWIFLLLMLVPSVARCQIDTCTGSCLELDDGAAYCGKCEPQSIYVCDWGCTCAACIVSGYGWCNCNNQEFHYVTYGLMLMEGGCQDLCEEVRAHVRQSVPLKAGAEVAHVARLGSAGYRLLAVEEAVLIPNRCTHGYNILRPKIATRPEAD